MSLTQLLQWYNLIFLLPFGVAALFLVVSVLQMGDGDAEGDGGDGADGAGEAADGSAEPDAVDASEGGEAAEQDAGSGEDAASPAAGALSLLGVGRAPLSVVLEAFLMAWGFAGFWANQLLLKSDHPGLAQIAPSLAIGLLGGIIGARLTAELLSRLMPKSQNFAISRESLLGMTGRVTFRVTPETGRIRIYDAHGTLHDEPCRIAPGGLPIEKGCSALVMDRDAQGRWIVEEIAAPVGKN